MIIVPWLGPQNLVHENIVNKVKVSLLLLQMWFYETHLVLAELQLEM
jgi:hypothetical protein